MLPPLAAEIGGRWPPPENLHLTLVFLGEQDTTRLGEIEAALEIACRREPFTARWGGLGVFPGWSRARVAYLGVNEGGEEMRDLAGKLRRALPPGIRETVSHRFTPHLTLARFREAPPEAALRRVAKVLAPMSWQSRVEAVELYQSRLFPDGARYQRLVRRALGT